MLKAKKSINVLNWELKRTTRFLKCKKKYDYIALLWSYDFPYCRIPKMNKCSYSKANKNCFCRLNPKYKKVIDKRLKRT